MAVGSGIAGSFGVAAESTYGTYVAPSRFFEVERAVPGRRPKFVQGGGVAAGQAFERAALYVQTSRDADPSFEAEVRSKQFGLLLAHLLGSSATPVQQAATTAYLQTHTWGDNYGKSFTGQVGVPTLGGTVVPYSLMGCKILSAEFSCGVDELLQSKWELDAQDYSVLTGLSAPSILTTPKPFHFGQMNVKVGTYGAETAQSGIRKVTLKIARPQRVDRQYAGGTGKKGEPIWNGRPAITGSIETDFLAQADFADRVQSGGAISLVWEFVGVLIASTYYETIRFKLSATIFTAGDPDLAQGLDVVQPKFDFKAVTDDTNPPITVEYMSTDSAI